MAASNRSYSDQAKICLKYEVDTQFNRLCHILKSINSSQDVDAWKLERDKIHGQLAALKTELAIVNHKIESRILPQTVAMEFQSHLDSRLQGEDDTIASWARDYWNRRLNDVDIGIQESHILHPPASLAEDVHPVETHEAESTCSNYSDGILAALDSFVGDTSDTETQDFLIKEKS
ncbi:hypothetical protein PG988_011632 [Apiospora saccharicola]